MQGHACDPQSANINEARTQKTVDMQKNICNK